MTNREKAIADLTERLKPLNNSQLADSILRTYDGDFICQYCIRRVRPNVRAVSNMLAVGIAAITNTTITKERFLKWYDKHFTLIIVTDILLFVVVSCAGMEMAAVRYIGMAVINAISTTLWVCVMQNAINNTIEGQNLTIWQSLAKSYELYASLAGGLAILLIGDIHIEVAIAIQCTANLIMGLTDLKARKLLIKE